MILHLRFESCSWGSCLHEKGKKQLLPFSFCLIATLQEVYFAGKEDTFEIFYYRLAREPKNGRPRMFAGAVRFLTLPLNYTTVPF